MAWLLFLVAVAPPLCVAFFAADWIFYPLASRAVFGHFGRFRQSGESPEEWALMLVLMACLTAIFWKMLYGKRRK